MSDKGLDPMEIEDRRLEVRSEPVQEILNRAPGWITRIGTTIIFIILLLLLTATWFIKYPDILSSQIVLTDQSPPASLIARTSGKIEKLFVHEKQWVKKGDYLAYFQSTADIEDITRLKAQLDSFNTVIENPYLYNAIHVDTSLSLGELQADHSDFMRFYLQSIDLYANDYYAEKILAIQNQINNFYVLNEKLTYQKKILADDFDVAEALFDKDKKLYSNKVVSETEFLNKQSGYLQKKYSFEGITVNIINNNIQLAEYQKAILDLKQQEKEIKRNLRISIHEAYNRLRSNITAWERTYVLVAPIDGQVSFFQYWSENQNVNANDEIMNVVGSTSKLIGKVLLPAYGSGKVKLGQVVRIKFDGYPYREYGAIEGKIVSISKVPVNNQYAVDVELSNGLVTTYNKQLEYKQEMRGVADIVTEDLRLFQRIFNQIRSLLDNMTA